MSTALINVDRAESMTTGKRGILIQSMNDLARFAKMVHDSGLAPKGFSSPQSVAVAVQMGLEVGLSPMQALQSIAVINGRPGLLGDAALALVRASGLLLSIEERIEGEGEGDQRRAVCASHRRGSPKPRTTTFSVADAKRAKLWGKAGPWTDYPDRMLTFRARGFNLRDEFGDVLKGIKTVEELLDYPDSPRTVSPAENGESNAAAPPPLSYSDSLAEWDSSAAVWFGAAGCRPGDLTQHVKAAMRPTHGDDPAKWDEDAQRKATAAVTLFGRSQRSKLAKLIDDLIEAKGCGDEQFIAIMAHVGAAAGTAVAALRHDQAAALVPLLRALPDAPAAAGG